jgi:hypothetical protein
MLFEIANRVVSCVKESVKCRIQYHLNQQLSKASKDIVLARQFLAAQQSAKFAD